LLAERIREVIETPSLKRKLVTEARAKVKRFGWPIIAKKILSLYDSLKRE
jgi:glycosyltransferase involved in cell wall biosynthesis